MAGNGLPTRSMSPRPGRPETQTNLADILERVLDKGIVIAGDIQKLDSGDRSKQLERENEELRERLDRIERQLESSRG